MPESGIITSNNLYTGRIAPDIIMPMIADNVTFNSDAVKLHSDINGELVVGTQTATFAVQGYNDAFQADGTINQNLSNVVLQPVPMTINMDLPKSDMFVSYMADMLPPGIGINNSQYPRWVAQAISELIAPQNSSNIESIVWTGTLQDPNLFTVPNPPLGAIQQIIDQAPAIRKTRSTVLGTYACTAVSAGGVFTVTTPTNLTEGDVITVAACSGTPPTIDGRSIIGQSFSIISISGTAVTTAMYGSEGEAPVVTGSGSFTISLVTINEASIFQAANRVLKALPNTVKYAVDRRGATLKWVVSPNVADAWKIRMAQNGNAQANYLDINPATQDMLKMYGERYVLIYGFPALIVPTLPPNTMVLYPSDSIHVGMDIATDKSRLQIIDLSQTIASNFYRVRADWQIDTKITFANQFSLISPNVPIA
jgi:hypothetical protein